LSEVGVRRPIYACFYPNSLGTNDLDRYPKYMQSFGGDGIFLASTVDLITKEGLKSKKAPIFKFIDLNEFVEVGAIVLQKAVQAALNDSDNSTNIVTLGTTDGAAAVGAYQCPLTLQEFALLIRAVMMNMFKDTQCFVQGLYPRTVGVSPDNNVFCACVAGANSCALPTVSAMMLPDALVENMKACTYSIAQVKGKKGKTHPRIVLPVLGIFTQDLLDPLDYQAEYSYNTLPTAIGGTLNIFAPATSVQISLIDGFFGGRGNYCYINDPAALNRLITLYNDWINMLTPFITSLSAPSTDAGMPVLTNMNLTSYVVPAIDPGFKVDYSSQEYKKKEMEHVRQKEMRKQWYADYEKFANDKTGKVKRPEIGFEQTWYERRGGVSFKRKHLSTSPYVDRAVIDLSFYSPPIQCVYEQIQQNWIKPIVYAMTGTTQQNGNQALRMAAWQEETNQIVVTATNLPLTLVDQHDQFASTMVGVRNQIKKSFSEILTENNINGHANIFSDILNGLGTGLQCAESVARTVASVAPMVAY